MMKKGVKCWEDVTLKHLFFAYRKAKADCFFERSINISEKFSNYEIKLAQNLEILLDRIRNKEIKKIIESDNNTRIIAKKLSFKNKNTSNGNINSHGFFSDPERAFEYLGKICDLTPEFRIVGEFSVEAHIVSALWINLVGHKFDERITKNAYGSRLRRYKQVINHSKNKNGNYHLEAIGSFEPYFDPYKEWRSRGLQAIRKELELNKPVIAVSMDLTSYYHNIDPSFLSNENFLKKIGVNFNDWEKEFNSLVAESLVCWSKKVKEQIFNLGCFDEGLDIGGIPIGLSLSKIVANILLYELDKDIEQGLVPIYYGRYVDDIFLVMHDPGNIRSPDDILQFFNKRMKSFPKQANFKGEIGLDIIKKYGGKTKLILQQSKQKTFFLKGQGGLDFLGNIESQIRSVSSERRLMPCPDRLESMVSAKVLTSAGHPSDEPDSLRKADGLSVRRLSWAVQLRSVEILSRDLRADDWKKERSQFYGFAHSQILRPDKILDHLDYLPRLLALAVSLNDWVEAHKLIIATNDSLYKLKINNSISGIKINGNLIKESPDYVWNELNDTVNELARDAIARSIKWSKNTNRMCPLSTAAITVCKLVGLGQDAKVIEQLALTLREADWSKVSYKEHLRCYADHQRLKTFDEAKLYDIYNHQDELIEFLIKTLVPSEGVNSNRLSKKCREMVVDTNNLLNAEYEHGNYSLLPYLMPTRPYSTQEVSLYLPLECVFDSDGEPPENVWARYIRAVRGIWVQEPSVLKEGGYQDISDKQTKTEEKIVLNVARIGASKKDKKVFLGISSLLTTNKSFVAAASGRSDISRERYQRIERIVNQAIDARPKPTYLLLPELSLPERWINTVSSLLQDSGINLIAGLDYYREKSKCIHSEAVLILSDDRLGYKSWVQIRQAKTLPAPGEEETLQRNFGLPWSHKVSRQQKPLYIHDGFSFGVLVCSELQNVKHRHNFQGNVDCMVILSWNQDIETFSALVESASLDVHAHIALVNNRMYGDSRVRAPYKQSYERDICRLRGGKNEHVVVVEIDVEILRAFQSNSKRWPRDEDPYKPVPEGFKISDHRKSNPLLT